MEPQFAGFSRGLLEAEVAIAKAAAAADVLLLKGNFINVLFSASFQNIPCRLCKKGLLSKTYYSDLNAYQISVPMPLGVTDKHTRIYYMKN